MRRRVLLGAAALAPFVKASPALAATYTGYAMAYFTESPTMAAASYNLHLAVSSDGLKSYNFPDRYVRHSNYVLRIDPVSTATEKQDATFRVGY